MVETGNHMTSVERVLEYTKLGSEAPVETDKTLQITSGHMMFKGVCMKYREHLDYALRDLNIEILGGEKVGVVGRTGAGKSTILQTIFRLTE